MRILSIASSAAITLGVILAGSASIFAQSAATTPSHPRILGYQDPNTGIFHPLRRTLPQTAGTSPATGTIEVTLTITLATALTTGQTVSCTVNVEEDSYLQNTTTFEATDGYDYYESAYGIASVTGTTATCKLSIPYSWTIPVGTKTTPLEQTLSGGYEVSTGTGSETAGMPKVSDTVAVGETSSRTLSGTFALPATLTASDGIKTKIAVNATL
jgi:hypothetical protein